MFLIALVGTLAALYVLFQDSAQATFRSNLSSLVTSMPGDPVAGIDASAKALGWQWSGKFTLLASVPLLVWPFLPLVGSVFSMVIGGEVRNNTWSQLAGMFASLVASAALFLMFAHLSDGVVTTEFQGAAGYIADNAPAGKSQLLVEPYITYWIGLATQSLALRILVCLGFIAWAWFWIPGVLAYAERAFLAWALDRLAPAMLGDLHPKFGTPYVAVILAALISQVFLILILFSGIFATLVFIAAAAVAWLITLLLGIFYPFRRKKLYTPSILSKLRLLGIPLMTLCCAAGTISLAVVVVLLWSDPIAAGNREVLSETVASLFLFGFIYFYCARLVRRKQGYEIGRAYEEIPIE